jgi:hypothetical protein
VVARMRGHEIEELLYLRQAFVLDATLPVTLRQEAQHLESLQCDATVQCRRQLATWIEQAIALA